MHGEELAKALDSVLEPQIAEIVSLSSSYGTRCNFSPEQLEDIALIARRVAVLAVMEYDHLTRSDRK